MQTTVSGLFPHQLKCHSDPRPHIHIHPLPSTSLFKVSSSEKEHPQSSIAVDVIIMIRNIPAFISIFLLYFKTISDRSAFSFILRNLVPRVMFFPQVKAAPKHGYMIAYFVFLFY